MSEASAERLPWVSGQSGLHQDLANASFHWASKAVHERRSLNAYLPPTDPTHSVITSIKLGFCCGHIRTRGGVMKQWFKYLCSLLALLINCYPNLYDLQMLKSLLCHIYMSDWQYYPSRQYWLIQELRLLRALLCLSGRLSVRTLKTFASSLLKFYLAHRSLGKSTMCVQAK